MSHASFHRRIVSHIQQWTAFAAQCEEFFLGRARHKANQSIVAALQLQPVQEIEGMESDDLCCLGLYREPLSELVLAIKMQRWSRAATALGTMLARKASVKFGMDKRNPLQPWLVVPIPTPFLRRLTRGIDHSDLIASSFARELKLPLRRVLWQRYGRSQKTLDRTTRLGRKQRFAVRRRHRKGLVGRRILLIDDIRTTGATLAQARQVLLNAGASQVAMAVVCAVEG